jgi:hypothetical protein
MGVIELPLHDGPGPQGVLPVGYWQVPDPPMHDRAPQVPPVVHAAMQQLPLPLMPHTPLVHWLSSPHDAPGSSVGPQVPLEPGLKQAVLTQSLMSEQACKQSLPSPLHFRLPGHGPCVPGLQAPLPSQALAGVTRWPAHERPAPQGVDESG